MAYVPEDNRAMLRKENWDAPLQSVWDSSLVLGRIMPVEETDSLAVRYMLVDNDDADTKIREPGAWDIGTDFPEVSLSELGYDSTVINGLGVMVKFDPKRIYYNDGVLDIKDAQRRVIRKWGKKVDTDIFNDVTASRASAHGGQFTSTLSQMEGGLSTGSQKNWVYSIDTGKAWNQEGDAVQQLREMATTQQAANRLASLGGDIEFDPMTTTIFLESLSFGALHDQLRDNDVTFQAVGTKAITVTGLYGYTFAVADNAIANTGDALMVDLAATPLVYKQSLPPLPGYHAVGFDVAAGGEKNKIPGQVASASKLSLLVRDDDTESGGVEVRFAHLGKSIVRKPKSMAYLKGTFA